MAFATSKDLARAILEATAAFDSANLAEVAGLSTDAHALVGLIQHRLVQLRRTEDDEEAAFLAAVVDVAAAAIDDWAAAVSESRPPPGYCRADLPA